MQYERLFTFAFNNLNLVRKNLNIWLNGYNKKRFHQGLDDLTPDQVY
ncbi:integrase core domain-containing protein [Nitrosomonas mobilis]